MSTIDLLSENAELRIRAEAVERALDEEMVNCYLGVFNPGDDAKAALHQIISWHVDVALDPGVSARARAMLDRALFAEARMLELEEREASCCPEDIGCDEYIAQLSAEVGTLRAVAEAAERHAVQQIGSLLADYGAVQREVRALRNDLLVYKTHA